MDEESFCKINDSQSNVLNLYGRNIQREGYYIRRLYFLNFDTSIKKCCIPTVDRFLIDFKRNEICVLFMVKLVAR